MALSGEFYNYPTSKGNFGLYCTWSATQSVSGNYSDVTLNVYLKYYSLYVGDRPDSTISINGTSETYTAAAISEDSNTSHTKLLKSKTVRVTHNTNGTKTGVALSASWRFSGTYSGETIGTITASTTIDLDSLDRTAPTVSFSTSNITANGFTISATSSATADQFQYSTNGGTSWSTLSTTAGTSASKAITGLTPNTTYSVKVRARKQSNQVYGTSSAVSVKTLGGSVVNSVSAVTADASTVKITLNVTVYDASYIHTLDIKNGSTTILTVTGLSWSKGTADRSINLMASERTTLLEAMANMKSFTGTFAVTTYGDTQIGAVSTGTATVSTTAATSGPTLSGMTTVDSYSTTTAITGNNQYYIQGYSKLQVTPGTATAKNGATITNYTATCNGVSVSNTTGAALAVGVVNKSGTVAVVLTITDSRGYTASVTQNITVLAYASPKVSSVSLRRTNDIEAEMQLIFNGSISSLMVGSTEKNSLQGCRYRYKLTSADTYGSYTSILSSVTKSGMSFSYSNLQLRSLDANSSFDVHLQIYDKLSTTAALNLYFVVPQGTPLVALRKGKVGINTPNPTVALDVNGDTYIGGKTTFCDTVTTEANILPDAEGSAQLGSSTRQFSTVCSQNHRVYCNGKTYGQFYAYATGTTETTGEGRITLGNSTAKGTADNAIGRVYMYGAGANYHVISPSEGTANYTHYLPNNTGYLVSSGSSSAAVGGTAKPVYISSSGVATALSATAGGTTQPVYLNAGTLSAISSVAVAYGGTGATTAAAARTNLGVSVTSLYSGTLTSGSTTFNYGNYNAYIIIGTPKSSSSICTFIIPKAAITTTAMTYQYADEQNYVAFKLSYSGTTCTLAYQASSASGAITKVYGIN